MKSRSITTVERGIAPPTDPQVALETRGRQQRSDEYESKVALRISRGSAALVESRRSLISSGVPKLGAAVEAWVAEWAKIGRRRPLAYDCIKGHPPEELAFLTLRAVLNKIGSGRQAATGLATSLGRSVEAEVCFLKLKVEKPAVWQWLKSRGRLDESTYLWRATTLKKASQWSHLTWKEWTPEQRLNVGVNLLNLLQNTLGLVELVTIRLEKVGPWGIPKQRMVYMLTPAAQRWFEDQDARAAWGHPLLFPMLEEPVPWTTPQDGGYVTMALPLVKTSSQTYLEGQCHRDLSRVYDAVNALQRTPFVVDEDVVFALEHAWKNDWRVKGTAELDEIAEPVQPEGAEVGTDAYKLWKVAKAQTRVENDRASAKRYSIISTLKYGKAFKKDLLYFPVQCDWRGRTYPAASCLSPQGPDYQRGMLKFAEAKPLTNSQQWAWLKIHGANAAGPAAKQDFGARIKWVDDHEDLIVSVAEDPLSNRAWTEVDKPFAFLAFCIDYLGALRTGMSSLPVAMDGSCSGLQHFSAMLRDRSGAQVTNLTTSALPQDIYANVAHRLEELVKQDASAGVPLSQAWLNSGLIGRDLCKRPTMTTPYGVTAFGVQRQTSDWLRQLTVQRGQEYFESSSTGSALMYIAPRIFDAISGTVPKAMEAMEAIRSVAGLLADANLQVGWTLPHTGFQVQQSYYRTDKRRVVTILNGETRSFNLQKERKKKVVAKGKARAGSAPNLIHSLDAAHLMMTVSAMEEACGTPVSYAMVHDSFATHAADAPLMAATLRRQFVKLYEDPELLGNLMEQMKEGVPSAQLDKWPEVPALGDFDLDEVLASPYFFA